MDDAHENLPSVASLLPAAAILLGTGLGRGAIHAPPGLLVPLALVGLALASGGGPSPPLYRRGPQASRRLAGLAVAALAAGFLNGHVRGGPAAGGIDPATPVTAVVETTGHWRRLGDVWSAPVRVERLRQGDRVVAGRRAALVPVYLHLASEDLPPPFGMPLRVKGFLSRPAPLGNLPPRPPGSWRLRVKSGRLVEEAPGGRSVDPMEHLAGRLRSRVEAALGRFEGDRGDPGRSTGLGLPLARALLLGDASRVPPRVVRGMRRMGLAHVLAVSGLHVGLVAGLILLLASPLPPWARRLAGLAAVVLYLLLVGPRPSLVRASAMACLAVAALLAERPPVVLHALAVVAGGIALARPFAVAEPGFQLSVGATAGLLIVGPLLSRVWARRLRWLPARVREGLSVSVGAQLGTLPWALPLFCLAVPVAPLVNLVAVPWTTLLLPAAGLWTFLAVTAPPAAEAALPLLDALAVPFGWPAALPPSPWLSLPLAASPAVASGLSLALLAALLRPRFGVPAMAAALAWAVVVGPGTPRPGVELVMVDVGQGDAVLLRDGPETLLVDGGGWPAGDLGGRVLLPALARLGVRRLGRVLLTHGDRDHCGGLVEVASYLAVGEVLTGPGPARGGCEAELRRLPGVRQRGVAAGDGLRVGRWRIRVLHPPRRAGGSTMARAGDNDASVVLGAEVFGRRVLLTGDVEAPVEGRLVRREPSRLACHVLKVAHHGSRSSSTPAFLAAASPGLALVSAGARNPYGHPAPEVLARLHRHGARVLRTDRDGMIVLRYFSGGGWRIDLPGSPKG